MVASFTRFGRSLRHGTQWLGDLLAPPRCSACQERIGDHDALCTACWTDLPFITKPYCHRLGVPFAYDHGPGMVSAEAIAHPPAYGHARAAARYEGCAVSLVHRLKYGDRVDMARLMGGLMAQAGRDILARAQVLVPIPLHRLRLWQRRFNQSALLADEIGRRSHLPVDPFLLMRKKKTRPQVGQSRLARAGNVQGAFAVPESAKGTLPGRHIVLVDDVLTSGATVEAAARALTRAGAANVDVLVFARVTDMITG